jgi:hypothetical protein
LTSGTLRTDQLVRPPKLPAAAARQVIRSLLQRGLVEEVRASIEDSAYAWRTQEDGVELMLRATALGLARIAEADGMQVRSAVDEAAATAAGPTTTAEAASTGEDASTSVRPGVAVQASPTRARADFHNALRQTAQALLDGWDDPTNRERDKIGALEDRFAALRAALAAGTFTREQSSRQPRDTKQAQVLAMLRRDEGASGPQIAAAMGWAPHTVRGFLAGLAKKGIQLEVLERVRQVGPNKQGAKGTITSIASQARGRIGSCVRCCVHNAAFPRMSSNELVPLPTPASIGMAAVSRTRQNAS